MNEHDVFVNCPFTPDYKDHFNAIVFTVVRSGYVARCARENDDGDEVRYEKICRLIRACRLSIHDISLTELDAGTDLPRFNMPFELGLSLGAKRFGGPSQRSKKAIIFDREAYRYQAFLSDIAGQDIHSHRGDANVLIEEIAAWLRGEGHDAPVPGGQAIAEEFRRFQADVPAICALRALHQDELTFRDYRAMAAEWIVADAARP